MGNKLSDAKRKEVENYIENYVFKPKWITDLKDYYINNNTNYMTSLLEAKQNTRFISTTMVKEDLSNNHESFSHYLYRLIDKKNMSHSNCYNDSMITRGTFNKIINGKVRPTRETIALLAIGLKLSSEEYDEFLHKAGYARSTNINDPLNIVGYYIDHDENDYQEIEEAVYEITGKYLYNCRD